MRRLALVIALLLVPIAAHAFDPAKPGTIRIGILSGIADPDERHGTTVRSIPSHLRAELRRGGFDAFTLDRTFEQLEQQQDQRDADFYVEVMYADRSGDMQGGVGIYGRNAEVGVGVISTNIDARINVYDGATLDLIAQYDVDKSKTLVAPTHIGVGSRNVFAFVELGFGWLQYRSAARAVAKTAAARVAETVREP